MLGILLLTLAANVSWLTARPNWQAIIRDLGALFVASITVATLWDLFSKRAFLSELLATTQLAEDITEAGIGAITSDFYRGIDWPTLFGSTSDLDVFFTYGSTWRGSNRVDLQRFAKKKGARVRVVLPDPENPEVVAELAHRFRQTPDEVKRRIEGAKRDFEEIFDQAQAEFSLWFLPLAPVYSVYGFGSLVVITFYNHGRGKMLDIPTFVGRQGGTLHQFVTEEFEDLVALGGQARKVIPKAKDG
ncbi:MAG TPA: hypothetical protein VE422_28570 [Terriglobia bacterium]|nr:hypothetical protein [Terriglobia bacterium]